MKLQRSTLILMLVALSLGTAVYLTQAPGPLREETAREGKEKLFTFQADDIQAVTLKMPERTLIFERQAIPPVPEAVEQENAPASGAQPGDGQEKTPEGKDAVDGSEDNAPAKKPETADASAAGGAIASRWLIKAPVQGPANDAYVSYLIDLLIAGGRDRALEVSPDQLSEYGLDQPQATVEIRLKTQKTHTLRLGSPNFDRSSLYAQIDPAQDTADQDTADAIAVLLVSSDFENAINRSLEEWQDQTETPKGEETDTSNDDG